MLNDSRVPTQMDNLIIVKKKNIVCVNGNQMILKFNKSQHNRNQESTNSLLERKN